MDKIKIQHPNLPDIGVIEVARTSLATHVNAGWEEVPEEVAPEGGGVPADEDSVKPPRAPRRASRNTEKTEDEG